MNNADMPAMPHTTWDNDVDQVVEQGNGFTKREYAAIEMAKIIDAPSFCVGHEQTHRNLNDWADRAAMMADALLDRLEKFK